MLITKNIIFYLTVLAFQTHLKTSEMLEKSIALNQLHNVMLVKNDSSLKRKCYTCLSVVTMDF